VGAKSSAVPTTTISIIITISSVLLPMKGAISATTCAGMLATVISQAHHRCRHQEHHHGRGLAGASMMAYKANQLDLAVDELADHEAVDRRPPRQLRSA
jgi:hypothetical protein